MLSTSLVMCDSVVHLSKSGGDDFDSRIANIERESPEKKSHKNRLHQKKHQQITKKKKSDLHSLLPKKSPLLSPKRVALPKKRQIKKKRVCCECTCYMHTLLRNREGLEPRHVTWSVASQHCTVITTCDQTEKKELVRTSRFVRVIRDSEDQSEQGEGRNRVTKKYPKKKSPKNTSQKKSKKSHKTVTQIKRVTNKKKSPKKVIKEKKHTKKEKSPKRGKTSPKREKSKEKERLLSHQKSE